MVPFEAFHVAQIQKTKAKAPRPAIGRQADKPIGNLGILITKLALLSVAGLADAECSTRQCNTDAVL